MTAEELEKLKTMPELQNLLRWAGKQILEDRPDDPAYLEEFGEEEDDIVELAEYLIKLGTHAYKWD